MIARNFCPLFVDTQRFNVKFVGNFYIRCKKTCQIAVARLIKNKTVLVIAHRMRTVSGADKVVVLSDGIVAEQGTPEELIRTGKIYPHMMQLQMMSGGWEI